MIPNNSQCLILLATGLHLSLSSAGQTKCVVSKDQPGRIITTCTTKNSIYPGGGFRSDVTTQMVLKGTPFVTYPDWQPGRVSITGQQRELIGEVAYDLVNNTVYYRYDSIHTEIIEPDLFFINADKFINASVLVSKWSHKVYYQVLYEGTTILAKQTRRKAVLEEDRSTSYNGYYQDTETYFLKRTTGRFVPVKLTKQSIRKVLGSSSTERDYSSLEDNLSIKEVINLLKVMDERQN